MNQAIPSIDRFYKAFLDLQIDNKEGHIKVKKNDALSFDVTVKDKGTYKLYANIESRKLFLQSPTSGMFSYEYD